MHLELDEGERALTDVICIYVSRVGQLCEKRAKAIRRLSNNADNETLLQELDKWSRFYRPAQAEEGDGLTHMSHFNRVAGIMLFEGLGLS